MNCTNENKTRKILFNVIKAIIIIILIPIIFFNSVIIIDSIIHKDEVPSFFGWKPLIVMSGSMIPQLNVGDLAVVKEVDPNTLQVGDIIAFKESENFIITHRIADITYNEENQKEFVTKGDNNNDNDIGTVGMSTVEGKFITGISKLGKLLLYMQTPIGTVISVSIPIIILLIIHAIENKNNTKYIINETKENEDLKAQLEELKKKNEELANKR